MNKKLLAVAVAAALVAPLAAFADGGNVTISGDLKVSIDSLDNGDTRQLNASSNSSHIAFSGNEDLGNGLKAVWQLDQQVNMGGTGGTGGGNNTFTSRNSFLGLAGGFGTAVVGKHDTPVKLLGRKVDLFGDQIGDSRNLISDGQGAFSGTNFDLRPDNVIAYITPSFSGLSGVIAYVTNVGSGATEKSGCGNFNCATAWSGLVAYDNGPLSLGLGYEKHELSRVISGANDQKVLRLVGGYGFGDAKVVALWQKEDDLAGSSNGRKVWGLGAAYNMGATTIKGQYYKADNIDNADQTGAKMFALGVDYALSKRTVAYAAYAKTDNDNAASFSAFGGGHGDNPGVSAAGQNVDGFSLGMTHKF